MGSELVAVARVLAAPEGLDATSRYVLNGDCLYCDGKPVGSIASNKVLLKKTGMPVAGTGEFAQARRGCERHPPYLVPEGAGESGRSGSRFRAQRTRCPTQRGGWDAETDSIAGWLTAETGQSGFPWVGMTGFELPPQVFSYTAPDHQFQRGD